MWRLRLAVDGDFTCDDKEFDVICRFDESDGVYVNKLEYVWNGSVKEGRTLSSAKSLLFSNTESRILATIERWEPHNSISGIS